MSLIDYPMSQTYAAKGVILPRWMLLQICLKGMHMAYSQLTAQLRTRGELLLGGRIEEMVASYIYPLPMYLQSRCLVLNSPLDAFVVFDLLRTALLERGVVSLRPQVTAVDIPRGGRFRVWADWHELTHLPENTYKSSVIYYCRETGLGPQVEMINYTHMSMPELNQQFAGLALSA
jgi:hypothetical protein